MNPDQFGPDWRVLEKLGEGTFSEVYKVMSVHNHNFYAVKQLRKRYRSVEEVNKLPEIATLRALQGHPNIIKLEEVLYDSSHGCLALVFEILDQNLFELIKAHQRPFDEKTSLLLIYQLLKALAYMHSKNLFHRDIKPENCMVNKNTFELKLADFGSTRQTFETGPFTEYIATRWYRAPECILTSGSYGSPVDIWAVGCVLFEVLTTRPLFPGKTQLDQIARIHNIMGTPGREVLAQFKQNPNVQINYAFPHRIPQEFQNLLPNTSPQVVDLLSRLLVYDPSQRVTAAEALQHPAFELFRRLEPQYRAANVDMPFSLFVLTQTVQAPLFRPPTSSQSQNQSGLNLIQLAVNSQLELEEPTQSHSNSNSQSQSQNKSQSKTVTDHLRQPPPRRNNNVNNNNEKTLPFRRPLPLPAPSLAQSRQAAIERIISYNRAKQQQPRRAPAPAPLHFGPQRVVKPPPAPPQLAVVGYQRPTADLVKPRLAGIPYRLDRP